ncbi:DUF488 domain-containing protein [Streptomyces sp. TR06-5]|uniref:DUF488 domain-containing protein n=1 Tax=unclassified Streptomyces TaxID=2593676 RepID=UPI0039A1B771
MGAEPRDVRVGRIYDVARDAGAARVLVDRLWPRGMSKERADLAAWAKDVAPSHELRRWYGHDPERREEFVRRYHEELRQPERARALSLLHERAASGPLLLLTAVRDVGAGHAAVLADILRAAR